MTGDATGQAGAALCLPAATTTPQTHMPEQALLCLTYFCITATGKVADRYHLRDK